MPGQFDSEPFDAVTFDSAAAGADPPLAITTNVPTISVEAAFGGTAEAPVYTTITPWVMSYETQRGRNDELQRDEAGTCVLVLANEDRRFEPEFLGDVVNLLPNPALAGASPSGYHATQSAVLYGLQEVVPSEIVADYSVRVDAANSDDSGIAYDPGYPNWIKVTAGRNYGFSLYALGASGSTEKAMSLAVLWADAIGTLLSWSTVNRQMLGSNSGWKRLWASVTAPTNAAYAIPHFFTNGAQGAFSFYTVGWQFEENVEGWSHRITGNPSTFNSGTLPATYYKWNSASTLAVDSSLGADEGPFALVSTPGTTGANDGWYYDPRDGSMAVDPGRSYRFSASLRRNPTGTQAVTMSILWYDRAGNYLSEQTLAVTATQTWTRSAFSATAPANASFAIPSLYVPLGAGLSVAADLVTFEAFESAPTAYSDGNQPTSHWGGAANASVSYSGGSPYAPNIRPFLRFRIRETWDEVERPVFDGYAEQYSPLYSPGSTRSDIRVKLSDAFIVLSRDLLHADWSAPVELSHLRLHRVLDAIGWPAADRDIALGHSLVAAVEPPEDNKTTINPLEHMKQVARAEAGRFFVDAAGRVAFQCRHYGTTGANTTPQATFSYQGPAYYSSQQMEFGKTKLYNEVRAKSSAAKTEHVSRNEDSVAFYRFTLALPLDLTPLLDENELEDAADYWTSIYSWAKLRFQQLVLEPAALPGVLWPQALDRELGDRVQVDFYPPPWTGDALSKQLFIQGISQLRNIEENTWLTTFTLSPFGVDYPTGQIWLLDGSGDTTLGDNSNLRY